MLTTEHDTGSCQLVPFYAMVLFLVGLTQKLFLHLMVIESYFKISNSLSHILLFMAAFSPTDAAVISAYS